MPQDIQERQYNLQEKRLKHRRLIKRLEQTSQKLIAMKLERDRLHQALTKEQQDVVKLGKFSFAKKISEWTGTWDEKMKKDIEEAAEAELIIFSLIGWFIRALQMSKRSYTQLCKMSVVYRIN
ncbi:hypothetical protein CSV79_07820 [Sporosarcina sp. P13]|uniref:hypothetical protein n=1 Tax=Sporosarcina sp. P13 TaxID=2048263 RepID=UPI000C16BFD4|nr:hypothetical protein [Sporosarcina sp. P13]PIC64225.1 hypothetical protein CSV79_07820 [Sporosarcina sp. P13]